MLFLSLFCKARARLNILIVRVSSLGDVIHTMPMLADIHQHYPQANIDWVVEENYVDLVRLNKHVRHIIPFALRRWRKTLFSKNTRSEMKQFYQQLRQETYDVVIDAQGLFKTGLILSMVKTTGQSALKVGLANGTQGSGYEPISRLFHTKSVAVDPYTPAVKRSRLLASSALNYPIETAPDFGLTPPDVDTTFLPQQPYVAFFHATAGASKKWAVANWVAIGQQLKNYAIVLPWGNAQEKQAADVLAAQIPHAMVLPKLSMMQAVAMAQKASLIIGLDTGLTHIAAAYYRPTIELYCDSPKWKTEGDWSPAIINLGDKGMPPSVDDVKKAIITLGFDCSVQQAAH